jgi:hypothetical protein
MPKYLELMIRIPLRKEADNVDNHVIAESVSISHAHGLESGLIVLTADENLVIDSLAHITGAEVVEE